MGVGVQAVVCACVSVMRGGSWECGSECVRLCHMCRQVCLMERLTSILLSQVVGPPLPQTDHTIDPALSHMDSDQQVLCYITQFLPSHVCVCLCLLVCVCVNTCYTAEPSKDRLLGLAISYVGVWVWVCRLLCAHV